MKNSCLSLFILVLTLTCTGLCSAPEQGFLRFPAVYQNQVVFTSEGDLWIAPLTGGVAHRLTVDDGEERYAKFSPDGKWIAYTGEYDGNYDVYVIPLEGGEPKRLTFHPATEIVVGWTPEGRIMFRTMAFSGTEDFNIYTVSPEGDYPQSLGLDKATLASFEPKGTRIAYTQTFRNNATWKHYKGGWADQIWVADLQKKQFGKKPISTYLGHNSYPMWIGNRIYFLSDSTGRKNIWSMKPDGSDQKPITFHQDYDARWPSNGDSIIVYQLAMDIWKLELKNGKYTKIDIRLPSERLLARTRIINPADYIGDFDLNKDGKWLVIEARGQLFTVPTKSREALIRRLTGDFNARAKHPFYLGDKVVTLTDATREDEFFQYDPFLKSEPKQLSKGNNVWRYECIPSPDEKYIAFSDGNMTLWTLEVETGKLNKIVTGENWEIRDFSWSPDSRYLAYSDAVNEVISAIHIYDLQTKENHLISDLMYNSYFPAWDPKGKYLYFVSETNHNPLLGGRNGQFVYYNTDRLYLYLLARDAKSPFAPDSSLLGMVKEAEKDKEKEQKKGEGEKKEEGKKEEEKKEEKIEVKIDWEGLSDRMVEIPVSPGYYGGLRAGENMLYYFSAKNEGMMSNEEGGPKLALNLYKFEEQKEYTVITDIDSYDLSDDGKVVVVRQKSSFIRMDAGATEAPKGEGADDPHVKLEGWNLKLEPRQEWKQMFREAWRIQRDFFYDPNMHGLDWPQVLKQYEPLINRISTRDELNDLIGEMIGELNAGHAYVFGGDIYRPKQINVGLLGADISRDAKSGYFRIDKIYAPDKANEDWNSPLIKSGVEAKAGEYIIAIDGIPTNKAFNYLELLQDKAGKDVILTLSSKPAPDSSRDVIVKPIGTEFDLRYKEWVKSRREYVSKASNGKIGYLHLYDMMATGLSEFGQQFYPQYDKPAMILDVRNNHGGFVAPMILAQLDRKLWSIGKARRGSTYRTPDVTFYGYYAIVCNAETGSDGETFTEGAKLLGLGPVIGTRTWGGWVGIRADKPLNDRVWFTTPEFSGWGVIGKDKGKWLIEGPGVKPDIEVINDPASVLEGKDPQLDEAIKYLLDKIEKEPKKLPEEPPIPKKEVNFPK